MVVYCPNNKSAQCHAVDADAHEEGWRHSMDSNATAEMNCRTVTPTRTIPDLTEDVVRGLFASQKHLPPKYFYDDKGSELFDQICDCLLYTSDAADDSSVV